LGFNAMTPITFLPAGDTALTVEFSREISEEANGKVRWLAEAVSREPVKGLTGCVPTFRSVTLYYDPAETNSRKLSRTVKKIMASYSPTQRASGRVFHIPVCYDGEFSPDMADVCAHTGLGREEVIAVHSERAYRIYMLGFLPGFPYLGGMDGRIATPRLTEPRTAIPAGAVGIGGEQTGIYPLASPGGWRLIGRTPVKVYDPARKPAILYSAGDYIKFEAISLEEYARIAALVEAGQYDVVITEGEV